FDLSAISSNITASDTWGEYIPHTKGWEPTSQRWTFEHPLMCFSKIINSSEYSLNLSKVDSTINPSKAVEDTLKESHKYEEPVNSLKRYLDCERAFQGHLEILDRIYEKISLDDTPNTFNTILNQLKDTGITQDAAIAALTIANPNMAADITLPISQYLRGESDLTCETGDYTYKISIESNKLQIELKTNWFHVAQEELKGSSGDEIKIVKGYRAFTRRIEIPVTDLNNIEIQYDESKSKFSFKNQPTNITGSDTWGEYTSDNRNLQPSKWISPNTSS
ncbi:MAG: hypothetical protein JSS09_08345, partial [Verrucomicrobia bacterium]|nr:hypothetical protein [Verrucomicrobiota bacterium]